MFARVHDNIHDSPTLTKKKAILRTIFYVSGSVEYINECLTCSMIKMGSSVSYNDDTCPQCGANTTKTFIGWDGRWEVNLFFPLFKSSCSVEELIIYKWVVSLWQIWHCLQILIREVFRVKQRYEKHTESFMDIIKPGCKARVLCTLISFVMLWKIFFLLIFIEITRRYLFYFELVLLFLKHIVYFKETSENKTVYQRKVWIQRVARPAYSKTVHTFVLRILTLFLLSFRDTNLYV